MTTEEPDIRKASNHTQRDLLNLMVRVRARIEGRDARLIRKEESTNRGMGETFFATHDKQEEKLNEVHE